MSKGQRCVMQVAEHRLLVSEGRVSGVKRKRGLKKTA